MGTWSASLFGSDIACDVRGHYIDLLRSGLAGRQASRRIISFFSEPIADYRDGPVVWLALAATQWKHGRLQPQVRKKALQCITSGIDLVNWEDEDPKLLSQRKRVLDRLRRQLESRQPPEKAVRFQKPLEPLKKIEKWWKVGQIVAYRRAPSKLVLFLVEFVKNDKLRGQIPYFVLLDWQGKTIPSDREIRKLQPIIECPFRVAVPFSVYPARQEPPPWDRLERLELSRAPIGLMRVERGGAIIGLNSPTPWKALDDRLRSVLRSNSRKKARN